MSEDLESRIKALEEKLTPSPDKVSSMKATNSLKAALKQFKENDKSTDEDAVWYLIRFNDFYMDFFDAMREPKNVRLSVKEDKYEMLIELENPYCGQIIKNVNLEMSEEFKKTILDEKVHVLEKRIQDLEMKIKEKD